MPRLSSNVMHHLKNKYVGFSITAHASRTMNNQGGCQHSTTVRNRQMYTVTVSHAVWSERRNTRSETLGEIGGQATVS